MTNAIEQPVTDTNDTARPVLLLRHANDAAGASPRRIALTKFCATIGREGHCDIQLSESNGVSRVHAQVFVIDGEVVVEDLASRNGTFVNAKVLRGNRQTTLKHGDVITIGKYRLKLANRKGQVRSGARAELVRLMGLWNAAAVRSVQPRFTLLEHDDNSIEEHGDVRPHQSPSVSALEPSAAVVDEDTATCNTLCPELAVDTISMPTPARQPPAAHGVRFERELTRRARKTLKRGAPRRTTPILQAAVARKRLQRVRRGL